MGEERKERKRIIEGIEIIVDEARNAAKAAIRRSDDIGESLRETVEGALSGRQNVVMVRLNKESLARIDELVEASVVNSRSEAAAFLIGEGIKKRQGLFDQIAEKIGEIRNAKDDLRKLIEDEPVDESTKTDGSDGSTSQ